MNRRKEIESQDKIITKILLKLFKIGLALVKALSGGKKNTIKIEQEFCLPKLTRCQCSNSLELPRMVTFLFCSLPTSFPPFSVLSQKRTRFLFSLAKSSNLLLSSSKNPE